MSAHVAKHSSPRNGCPTIGWRLAATAWGRSSTKARAWRATAWVHLAARVLRPRTSSWSRRRHSAMARCKTSTGSIPAFTARAASSSIATGPIPNTRRGENDSTGRIPRRSPIRRRIPTKDPAAGRIRAIKRQADLDRRILARTTSLPPVKGFTLSLSERNTPALFGLGQIDAIPPEVLIATAAQQPAEIRGRVNRSPEGRVSRFGWKAQLASLHEFVRSACANELGLEVPGHPQAISPLAPTAKAKGLDMTEADCDALVAYIRALPAPVVIDPSGPHGAREMEEGRRLFVAVGCATCHMPSLGDVQGIYSDLLLHDMGPSLSDSGTYYGFQSPDSFAGPTAQEWRTPPLWGYRDSGPYLHDGRARNLEQAVALHEGQSHESAHRFFSLTAEDRFQIEAFLKSLVAPSLASVSGIVLAADLETRVRGEERAEPEIAVRRRRDEAVAHGEREWRERAASPSRARGRGAASPSRPGGRHARPGSNDLCPCPG